MPENYRNTIRRNGIFDSISTTINGANETALWKFHQEYQLLYLHEHHRLTSVIGIENAEAIVNETSDNFNSLKSSSNR